MSAISDDIELDLGRARKPRRVPLWPNLDYRLLTVLLALLGIGLVMVASSSVSIADGRYGDPLFFFKRQAIALVIGAALALPVLAIPLDAWERSSMLLVIFAYLLLIAVLIPGVGREVNGAVRWIPLGIFNLQVSEAARVLIFLYLAGYMVRRNEAIRTSLKAFAVPIAVMAGAALLLLVQPDLGAAAVIVATGVGMLFLAGLPMWRLLVLVGGAAAAVGAAILTTPWRVQRLLSFQDPWADPFNSGFQLTQSLIAIGRGEWLGVGLGGSVQKLFYLPEAHTDFLFAVLAEEFGLVGVLLVLGLFGYVVLRAFVIATQSLKAGKAFGGYLAYGIGLWLGIQVFVNLGVNMGLLPTKGLTLPLMSYGGSSLIMSLVSFALLLRVDFELRTSQVAARPVGRSA